MAPDHASAVDRLDGFTHRYAEVNGTRIHYVIGGDGPAVVLLHGFPYSWEAWRELAPRLAAAGFTVMAPDLRGMGDSAPAEDGFAKTNVAEDVRAVVRSLALGPIRLVGDDIGAMVAYAYASRHPAEMERLVLAESTLPGFGLEELMNPATSGYWHFAFQMHPERGEGHPPGPAPERRTRRRRAGRSRPRSRSRPHLRTRQPAMVCPIG